MQKFLFILLFSLISISPAYAGSERANDCEDVLNWIVKDLTLKNLDKSVERMNNKLALAYFYAHNSSENIYNSIGSNPELLSLFEGMKRMDPDFENYVNQNQPYKKYKKWSWLPWVGVSTSTYYYSDLVEKWKNLQESNPNIFEKMPAQFKLDEWDIATGDILDKVNSSNIADDEMRSRFQELARLHERNRQSVLSNTSPSVSSQIRNYQNAIDNVHEQMDEMIKNIYSENLTKFADICPEEQFNALFDSDIYICPVTNNTHNDLTKDLSLKLRDLTQIVNPEFINNIKQPVIPDVPIEIVPNLTINDYEFKNIHYDGSYCERDKNMVDTAVVHHTATSNGFTPQDIHNTQVASHENDVDSDGNPDPWYMIAYNYAVTAGYTGNNVSVYQARPTYLRGAHAGGHVNLDQLDASVREIAKKHEIKCGYNDDKDANHTIDRRNVKAQRKFNKERRNGYISANMTSVGVAVIGNYMPDMIKKRSGGFSANPSGYPRNKGVRYPADNALKKVGELICKLKKEEHPHLRKITDHNYIKIKKAIADGTATYGTCCPGTVWYRMNKIRQYAMEACGFSNNEFVLDISPRTRLCYGLRNL